MSLEKALLMLYAMPGIGPRTLRRWLGSLPNLQGLFLTSPLERRALPGFKPGFEPYFSVNNLARLEEQADLHLQRCRETGLRTLTFLDAHYPSALRSCPDAPLILFHRGKLPPSQPTLTMVGTRLPSSDVAPLLQRFMHSLAGNPFSVCSGLARGVDAMVHRESLKNGFFSMAVVAHGADLAYPLQNESLAADLLENGCIWSEYPPGTLPEREFFPQRNRILAGMCQALVLVQSNRSGGAMITVRHALRYQRPLFAFAGAFTQPAYAGPLALISEGQAKALARPEQVLKALGLESKPAVRLELADAEVHFSENELPLVRELASEPGLFLDQLALRTQQSPAQVLALLSVMELEGKIEALPGNRYRMAGC